jgi:Fe-S oxidoreductase
MKAAILSLLILFAVLLLLRNVYGFLRIMFSAKRPSFRMDRMMDRTKGIFIYVFGQKRILKNYAWAGIEHFMLFWGFMIITFGSVEVLILGFVPNFEMFSFLGGNAQGVFLLILDIVEALVLIALVMGVLNRTVIPSGKRREVNSIDAAVILGLIFALMVSDFGFRASEIAMGTERESWLPISSIWASFFLANANLTTIAFTAEFFWWFHVCILLAFLNYLPYSKHSHVLTAVPNVFFQNLEPTGKMTKLDFENIPEDIEHFGSGKFEDFSWKDVLDAYTCTECGRCTDVCPAWATDKPLSPRDIVIKLRHFATENANKEQMKTEYLPDQKWVTPEELYACTTCGACVEQCPLLIDQMGKILEMRRYLTMEGKLTGPSVRTLQKLQSYGNPWGFEASDRAPWAKAEGTPVLGNGGGDSAESYDVIFWTGCFGAYDPRGQEVASTIAQLLKEAGVKFAIMGPSETCSGDPARRLGDEALYQELAMTNIETMKRFNVKKVVANCPHCFNTLKNEYPDFGSDVEVVSHSEFLNNLIKEGKLTPTKNIDEEITYHDPCYLGRHNRIFDEPREILTSIPGLEIKELDRSRENSFCCGAGGGKVWMEEEAPRVSWNRFDEIQNLGVKTAAVACPFCSTMFEDAAKHHDNETIKIKDVAEILRDSLDLPVNNSNFEKLTVDSSELEKNDDTS